MIEAYLATGPGAGGICAVWLHGEETELSRLCGRFFSAAKPLHCGGLAHGSVRDAAAHAVDEALLACPGPGRRILTGHGGVVNAAALLRCLQDFGVRIAAVPEIGFIATPRNLVEEEADELLPRCRTGTQAAMLLASRAELPELVRGIVASARGGSGESALRLREIAEGYFVAAGLFRCRRLCVAGPANSGKSLLFNILTGKTRALVLDCPGTTLDVVEEAAELCGLEFQLYDTPGFMCDMRGVEAQAWERAAVALSQADVVLMVIDVSRSADAETLAAIEAVTSCLASNCEKITVFNKIDLPCRLEVSQLPELRDVTQVRISCREAPEEARAYLETLLRKRLTEPKACGPLPFTERQRDSLLRLAEAVRQNCEVAERLNEFLYGRQNCERFA